GKGRRIPWQQFFQRLLVGLLIGLGIGLGSGLSYGLSSVSGWLGSVSSWLSYGLSFGLCSILLQVFLVKSTTAQSLSQTRSPGGRTKWQRLMRSPALQNGLLAWLLVG